MRPGKRPPSYSDSFLVMPYSIGENPMLEPLQIPITPIEVNHNLIDRSILFVIQGSLHILFISTFESIFYFIYVSQSENKGIIGVIDAYYNPLVQGITTWSNTSKTILLDILNYEINRTNIDSAGSAADNKRRMYNTTLINISISYSFVCAFIFILMCGIVYYRRVQIEWRKLLTEHLSFIVLLALYEYFFYITIIYKYTTISTAELNKQIVDGLYKALS
jgi:hypothetical protein